MKNIDEASITIQGQIGKGSFGIVYKANSNEHGIVAVKTYNDFDREKDLKEIEVLSKLNVPNVIRFYGICKIKGKESLVMEYASKGNLCEFIHSFKKNGYQNFPWLLRYKISIGIARGLFSIHNSQIVHRDIKSLNILLDDQLTPKIADLGESKNIESMIYMSKKLTGTFLWSAPESRFEYKYSYKSDIYSLGIVLWEIATGNRPFADKDENFLKKLCREHLIPEIPSECPIEFAQIINECLSIDENRRPDSKTLLSRLETLYEKVFNSNTINQPKNEQDLLNESIIKLNPQEITINPADYPTVYCSLMSGNQTQIPQNNQLGISSVIVAIQHNLIDYIIRSFKSGIDPNSIFMDDLFDGWYMKESSFLHFAARYGRYEIACLLLNYQTNTEKKNFYV